MTNPVSFYDYMRSALYGPDGYYMTERQRFGKQGDFYTSVQVSPLFAYLWSAFMGDFFASVQKDVVVAELGCGDGGFAVPLLDGLCHDALLEDRRIRYVGVDLSAVARSRAQERVNQWIQQQQESRIRDRVHVLFVSSLKDIPEEELMSYKGAFVFGNEWLDALPVHCVRVVKESVMELFVGSNRPFHAKEGPYRSKRFATWFDVTKDPAIRHYADRYLVPYARHRVGGLVAEAQTEMAIAIQSIYNLIDPIAFAFVDYGGYTEDVLSVDRPRGTLRAYRQHELVDDFLDRPGSCDITYDVDFSAVSDAVAELGYTCERLQRQGAFFLHLPRVMEYFTWYAANHKDATNAFKQLVLPGAMGDRFTVLLARRDL